MGVKGHAILALPLDMASLGRLPVRVRDIAGRLVGTGLTDTPIPLTKGSYQLSVQMPDGEERFATETVSVLPRQTIETMIRSNVAAQASNITFSMAAIGDAMIDASKAMVAAEAAHFAAIKAAAAAAPPPPLETKSVIPFPGTAGAAAPMDMDDLAAMATSAAEALPEREGLDVRMWRGHWLDPMEDIRAVFAKGLGEPFTLHDAGDDPVPGEDGVDCFIVMRHTLNDEAMIRMTIVPWDEVIGGADPRPPRQIAATWREGSSPPAIRFRSCHDSETNTLLDFLDSGVLERMQAVSSGFLAEAQGLLKTTGVSLLRGLLATYIALRSNTIDGLEGWLEDFAALAPSCPDIHAIQVEFYARSGDHARAAQALAAAFADDCPWFRSGLAYLYERMSLYLDLPETKQAELPISHEDWDKMRAARKRIGALAPYFVSTQSFTTFDIPE